MKPGIQRIYITDKVNGRGAYRFSRPQECYGAVNQIYRSLFPVLPGYEELKCSKDEMHARYDIEYGIDTLLNLVNGQVLRGQEKVLEWHEDTVTVELYQNPQTGEEGDWFKLMCDIYLVAYRRTRLPVIDSWIVLDWDKIKLYQDFINWRVRLNKKDGAKANFKWVYFKDIPQECIIAAFYHDNGQAVFINNSPKLPMPQYRMF